MTNIVIDRIDPKDTDLLAHLHNEIFRPRRDATFFADQFLGRTGAVAMVARDVRDAVGFYAGYELRPGVHFCWFCGVVRPYQRSGIGTQLMHAAADWARTEGYHLLRFECSNNHRAMLRFGLAYGYDIVGVRYDTVRAENLIILERLFDDLPQEPTG